MMFILKSVEKKWLYRKFEISTPVGGFEIVYNGHGFGFEEVRVDGAVALRRPSYFWYVPRFDFEAGRFRAVVRVSVSALFQIKKFSLEIGGQEVYSE